MIDKAKQLITDNVCTVAAVTPSGEIFTGSGATVRPLFRLVHEHEGKLAGAAVADKIVGRAAACLLCHAGVSEVFAFLMSESALSLLAEHGIKASYAELAPVILNRSETDLCPMEKIVEGVDDLEVCIKNIADFVAAVAEPNFK